MRPCVCVRTIVRESTCSMHSVRQIANHSLVNCISVICVVHLYVRHLGTYFIHSGLIFVCVVCVYDVGKEIATIALSITGTRQAFLSAFQQTRYGCRDRCCCCCCYVDAVKIMVKYFKCKSVCSHTCARMCVMYAFGVSIHRSFFRIQEVNEGSVVYMRAAESLLRIAVSTIYAP